MMKVSALIVAMCAAGFVAQDAKPAKSGDDAFSAVCPYSGEPAKKDKVAVIGMRNVYFCCDKCVAKFNDVAGKVNHQLVQTGQMRQTACPLTGRPVKDGMGVQVAGVEVGLCCPNCKGKAEKMEKDAAITAMFTGKNFRKAFRPAQRQNRGNNKGNSQKKKDAA